MAAARPVCRRTFPALHRATRSTGTTHASRLRTAQRLFLSGYHRWAAINPVVRQARAQLAGRIEDSYRDKLAGLVPRFNSFNVTITKPRFWLRSLSAAESGHASAFRFRCQTARNGSTRPTNPGRLSRLRFGSPWMPSLQKRIGRDAEGLGDTAFAGRSHPSTVIRLILASVGLMLLAT